MRRHRILLDTDMGTDVDDALCLALALASPEVELVAITTVSRDTALRARISKRLLELGGAAHVPVFAGAESPLGGGLFLWHGREGEGILGEGEEPQIEAEPAADAIARLLREEEGLEIVAVGPLTNLAQVLERAPELARRIGRLTIMGGHLREAAYAGHPLPAGADYNLCSDAAAACRVLQAQIPTRLVPMDVTVRTWLAPADLERIERTASPLAHALGRAIRIWTPIQRRLLSVLGASIGEENVAFLHDPLAIACVYDESFCAFEELWVETKVADGLLRTFERPAGTPGARPMRCAMAVEAERFRAHFLDRIAPLSGAG